MDGFVTYPRLAGLIAAIVTVSSSFGQAFERPEQAVRYQIEFSTSMPPEARVEVSFSEPARSFGFSHHGAWGLENGWAEFIDDLMAKAPDGRALHMESSGRASWAISDESANGASELSYVIRYDRMVQADDWPKGPRTTSAYTDGQALFLNLHSLLLDSPEVDRAVVDISAPDPWRVAVPWHASPTGENVYLVDGADSLIQNALVIGDFRIHELETDLFRASIVALGSWSSTGADLLESAIGEHIVHHMGVFDWREPGQLLVVGFPDRFDSGEAYHDGYVMVSPAAPNSTNLPIWANTIGHELFHYWNGQRIRVEPWDDAQWFTEGFTEYYANLSLVRSGLVRDEEFLDILTRHIILYSLFKRGAPFDDVSLVRAGENKGPMNPALYDGGALVAFYLDVLIRSATGNSRSLDDVMRECLSKCNRAGPLNVSDIVAIANEAAGFDLSDIFERFVIGTEMLPIETALSLAGIRHAIVAQHVHLSIEPRPSEVSLRIRQAILRGVSRTFDPIHLPVPPARDDNLE